MPDGLPLDDRISYSYIVFVHPETGLRPANLPTSARWFLPKEDAANRATKEVYQVITRRNWLIGAAATGAGKLAVPWVTAPHVVHAANLMAIRGTVMPIELFYYGYVDRLQINHRYRSGELRGESLLHVINEGVLRHIPPAYLAYDIAKWGTAELSLSARQERMDFFGYAPISRAQLLAMAEKYGFAVHP